MDECGKLKVFFFFLILIFYEVLKFVFQFKFVNKTRKGGFTRLLLRFGMQMR